MQLSILKHIVGFTLVGLHILGIAFCFIWLDDKMSTQDFRLTILILTPVTAVYAMNFLKDLSHKRFVDAAKPEAELVVTTSFATASIIFTSLSSVLILFSLYRYYSGAILKPDDLKDRLALVELVSGGFLGFVADTLFGSHPGKSSARKSSKKSAA
jgi:hypothetical protein